MQLPQLPPPPQTASPKGMKCAVTRHIHSFILANVEEGETLVGFHVDRVFVRYRMQLEFH